MVLNNTPEPQLDIDEVCALTDKGKSIIYAQIEEGNFPEGELMSNGEQIQRLVPNRSLSL